MSRDRNRDAIPPAAALEPGFLRPLRVAGTIAAAAGAAGSFASMLHVGSRNPSRLLLALFAVWVLSPFAALLAASAVGKRWEAATRATIYGLMLVLAVGSTAIYAATAFGPPVAKPAFRFLMVPLASWLLMAIAIPIAATVSRGRGRS